MRHLVLASVGLIVLVFGLALVPPASGEGEQPGRGLVATVGRETISSDDVVAHWYERYRENWVRTLEGLLDERIVAHESKRLGITVPSPVLRQAVDEEVEARRKQLQQAYGEQVDLAEVVRDGYGVDLAEWRRDVLVPRIRAQLLLQRIVRLDTRRRARLEVRVIVAPDEARSQRVMQKLKAGADFSLVALKESVDPTAQSGGTLPSIAKGDLTLPGVEAQLFAAKPGALVGPLAVTLDGRTQYHVYKVIRRTEPWTGNRQQLLARLEKDLKELPLDRGEFERWRARMRRDFRVRVFDPKGQPVALPSSAR